MCMEELEKLVERLIRLGGSPVAAYLRSLGRAGMRSTPRRWALRPSCRLESGATLCMPSRASNKLKQVDSRRFWDEHGDQRGFPSPPCRALRHECDNKAAVGVDTATGICSAVLLRGDVGTVLSFSSLQPDVHSRDDEGTAKRANAASHLFR